MLKRTAVGDDDPQHLIVSLDLRSVWHATWVIIGALALITALGFEEVVFAVLDPRRSLHGFVTDEYLGGYASSAMLAEKLVRAILPELHKRVPTSVDAQHETSVQLPRIVVLVDDYDILTAGGNAPLSALAPFVAMSREVNLNVVMTRRAAGASRGVYEQMFMAVRDSGATGLMFSGDRSEGALLGSVRPKKLPAGRAMLVRAGEPVRAIQTVWHSGDVEEAATVARFVGSSSDAVEAVVADGASVTMSAEYQGDEPTDGSRDAPEAAPHRANDHEGD